MTNKDFYWLLPDYLKAQLDKIEEDYGANSHFPQAWDELRKMYRNMPKRNWRDARTVVLDVINGTSNDIPEEPVTQNEAVAERSENFEDLVPLTKLDISQKAEIGVDLSQGDDYCVKTERLFSKKKKHKH